jgi:hypothetical protein
MAAVNQHDIIINHRRRNRSSTLPGGPHARPYG